MNDLTIPPVGNLEKTKEFEATCTWMAREYQEATAEIRRLQMASQEQSDRLNTAFTSDHYGFSLEIKYDNKTAYMSWTNDDDKDPLKDIFAAMKRRAWRILADKLGIRNVMSVAKRKAFDKQLEEGELPDISEQTIISVILGLADQAQDFAREAAKEVFDILRPRKDHWGGQYKTNDSFKVGRKVILVNRVESGYGSPFRPNYYREQELTAIDGIFHLLDGKGIMREHRGPLVKAITESKDGKGSTDFFEFRCFKNGNLHLTFRRLDLVKELNLQGMGEYVLGEDPKE